MNDIHSIKLENCRLCQQNPGEYVLQDNENLIDQIYLVTNIQLNDKFTNELPNAICKTCKLKIEDFIIYRNNVQQIDVLLSSLVQKQINKINVIDNSTNDTNSFSCLVCNKVFSKLVDFNSHTEEHKENYCNICDKFFKNDHNCMENHSDQAISENDDDSVLKKEESSTKAVEKTFLCTTCGKAFLTKSALTCHEKIHLDTKQYVCNICNLRFTVRSNLRCHERSYHLGMKFYCSQCTKCFVSKTTLERHEKTHLGIRDFKCGTCSSEFYTKKELNKHQKYHQGIRKYQCTECFKIFFENHHLKIHLRIHTGERPFKCEIEGCDKSFVDNQKLKRHHKSRHRIL